MFHDPRLNAPPTLSEKHGEARLDALYARHNASTAAYMEQFFAPPRKLSLLARLKEALRG